MNSPLERPEMTPWMSKLLGNTSYVLFGLSMISLGLCSCCLPFLGAAFVLKGDEYESFRKLIALATIVSIGSAVAFAVLAASLSAWAEPSDQEVAQ